MNRLQTTLQRVDPKGEFIAFRGAVPYASLPSFYKAADIGIFASSCENLPNILMEAMAAGLPLACSRLGPMPEVLGDAGVYFDPERPDDIARALRQLIDDPDLRARVAQAAFVSAQQYSWERCADATFDFLAGICRRHPSVEFLGKTNV
jgi:glycosyltransferase involved in cell wall biosynthesis